jgi:formyltetrahydrofolate hydrolase
MNPRIIILSGEKIFARFIYNGLKNQFDIHTVIFEDSEDPKIVYERRKKKVGFIKAYGQSLFDKYIIKRLIKSSKDRLKEIVQKNKLDATKIPEEKIKLVRSVNDAETISLIQSIDPEIIIVNNTKILKSELLNSVNGHFINIHSGILPEYRGYSGGYWALVNNDKKKMWLNNSFC